ncbi:hypothetical protein R6Q59_035615 [Mikania micrantha]
MSNNSSEYINRRLPPSGEAPTYSLAFRTTFWRVSNLLSGEVRYKENEVDNLDDKEDRSIAGDYGLNPSPAVVGVRVSSEPRRLCGGSLAFTTSSWVFTSVITVNQLGLKLSMYRWMNKIEQQWWFSGLRLTSGGVVVSRCSFLPPISK